MARPGFTSHRKFLRLVKTLGIPAPHVLGHVEFLWDHANKDGEPLIGDSVDVELAAGWVGECGIFCSAMLACGLIEETSAGYAIHDYWENAPDYVKARYRMHRWRKEQQKIAADKLRNGYVTVTQPLRECNAPLRDVTMSPVPVPVPSSGVPEVQTTSTSFPSRHENVAPATAAETFLTFPAVGKTKTWNLTVDHIAEWTVLYPGLDVQAECRKALAWIKANRPKTAKGYPRFLVSWLNRAVDSGGRPGGNVQAKSFAQLEREERERQDQNFREVNARVAAANRAKGFQ